ncbi:hypothetical protein VaNZ11_005450 [Volvox africanus]|uniref:MYND-type domain-containing protein n=1 Tax=Volvox africanus TaxID=51714 RepID=A0ABQ5S098_9CHLO|nr:hypothetical protein VaNZ11_005450 [Volvox africanus]
MLDFVSVLPDAREGVRRLSQVLSGIVINTRMSEVRKGTSQSFTAGGSFSAPAGSRMLSSEDAQLAQESVDRLAAIIALGPSSRTANRIDSDGAAASGRGLPDGPVAVGAPAHLHAAEGPAPGLEDLSEDQAEQYLTEMYDVLLKCRVPDALGELTAMATSALLGPSSRGGGGGSRVPGDNFGDRGGGGDRGFDCGGVGMYDEAAINEEAIRRRSMDLRLSLDAYARDGNCPSAPRPSTEGLLCSQKLGGHAQALLESICQMLLSCVFDPIWRHRDLLAQPKVRDLIVALSCSSLIAAEASICIKLRLLLCRQATLEAASHAWLLGFVSKVFTGLCRCMKAMVEFEACAALWAQLGDAFAAQLAVTKLVERFSAAAAAVHPSYLTWRPPPPPGAPVDMGLMGAGAVGAGPGQQRPGEIYLELCAAVEVFLEGLFHLTWHFTARAEEAAAAGPPPPLLVRDVLAAMEPEGSGSVADLLAAAAAAATASDVRSGVLAPLTALLGSSGVGSTTSPAWPALVSGPAAHSLAADWLAHVVARLDGGELLTGAHGLAPEVAAAAPLLHKPGPVDRDELPLLLSVCLAVAAAGAPAYLANVGGAAVSPARGSFNRQGGGRGGRRSLEVILNAVTRGGGGGGSSERVDVELTSVTVQHANRLLQLTARGLKTMAATQDAELAPYPAIHAAHSCAVALHTILKDDAAAQARANPASDRNTAAQKPPSRSPSASAIAGEESSGPLGAFVPPPPKHTALLLDSFQAALLCYSAFLHPDPDKDPLTLRAVERCHEQLLELCTSIGDDLRLGVAAVAYAAHAGLLPALEAVLRAAALTCRLETLRVLLTAVMSSVPALQQLLLSRDGYIFLTLRKLIIACVNLACPHPLEYPMPAVQPPNSRRSLTLIVQQCASINPSTAASTAPNSGQHAGPPLGRGLVPDWVAYGTTAPSAHQAAAEGGGVTAGPGRPSNDSAGGRSSRRNSGTSGASSYPSGRPLILPLAVDLLDTVSMLARRFIEVHEGRVAAAANIHMDAMGNALDWTTSCGKVGGGSDDGYGGGKYPDGDVSDGHEDGAAEDGEENGGKDGRQSVSSGSISSSTATTRRRRSFEREATELLPLAQLLPFALWWLSGPLSDLVDALAQEVINDDGSGSLFGDPPAACGSGNGSSGAAAASQRSHHPRASVRPIFQSNPHLQADSRRGSIELQQQPAAASAAASPPSYGKTDMRRRQSMDLSRAGQLSVRPVARGSIVNSLGGAGGGGDAAAANTAALLPPSMRQTPWSSPPGVTSSSILYGEERSWVVLSRCADTLHTLFRLLVTVSDLNRRAPHPDWSALIDSLQPQQLLARAVQLLVHGLQLQRQQTSSETNGRLSRLRGPPFPVLLSSLLSVSVCGVQYGWLVPESFGIPSATIDPAELEQLPYPGGTGTVQPPPPPPQSAPQHSGGGHGPVQGPLFSRIRRFTVISANPEGRAYQWAMVGDEEVAAEAANILSEDGEDSGPAAAGSAAADGDGDEDAAAVVGGGGGEVETCRGRPPRSVALLQAAAPGGAWSSLPPPPGPAVVPTRALQVLVSEYGSAADKVLFDLLLKGLSSKRNAGSPSGAAATTATATTAASASASAAGGGGGGGGDQFFWVPPSQSIMLRTCSNPCCMNLSGLHEAQLRLAACPRCTQVWYCSRHCQAMHWHTGHKAKCCVKWVGE